MFTEGATEYSESECISFTAGKCAGEVGGEAHWCIEEFLMRFWGAEFEV